MTARIPIGYITKVRIINETTKLFCKIILNLFSYKIRIYGIVLLHLYCLIIKNKKVMKNLHIIATDKPSRIYLIKSNNKLGITSNNPEYTKNFGSGTQNQHVYITNDEEIKKDDFYIRNGRVIQSACGKSEKGDWRYCKKIILTTDQDLIKDGVQAIDDDFLEWFVKNPSCESVEVNLIQTEPLKGFIYNFEYKIIIPKAEPKQDLRQFPLTPDECYKQETLEEASLRLFPKVIADPYNPFEDLNKEERNIWIEGAKWQQEQDKNKYSEEQVLKLVDGAFHMYASSKRHDAKEWLVEQFKKK